MINNRTFLLLSVFIHIYMNMQAVTYFTSVNCTTAVNWNNSNAWSTVCGGAGGAGVPAAGDNVTICSGHTVNGNANGSCLSLYIQGALDFTGGNKTINVGAGGLTMTAGSSILSSTNKTSALNVAGDFTTTAGIPSISIGRCNFAVSGTSTIISGSTVNLTNTIGAKTFGNFIVKGTFNNAVNIPLLINGNLQNDGSLTFGSGQITFGGATSNTVTGTSSTAFNSINIDKGTSSANILDVQSVITLTNGGLTLTNGTLKLSNSSISITPWAKDIDAAPYLIPAAAGLWCNGAVINSDPAFTSDLVGNALSGNWTVAGLLRISAGTVNLGNYADQRFRAVNGGTTQLIVEGGTFNVAGRISRNLATDNINFTMSGGTINVPVVGSTSAVFAPIQMDQTGSVFTMTSGTIVIRRAGGTNLGFTANAGTVNISGGVIQFGDASTPALQTMQMNSTFNIANLTVNSSNATCQLAANLTVLQAVTINSGTLDANNLNITVGGIWTNSATFIPGTGTVIFNGTGTQNIIKTGGEIFYNFTVNKPSGTVVLGNNLGVNNLLTLTAGNIDCGTNTLTLGTSIVSSGTLTYTTGTIIGKFQRWLSTTATNYLFPIGTSTYYRPVTINFTTLTGGTLTANFVSTNPGTNGLPYADGTKTIINQFTEGYWDMAAANGLASANYYIECTGNGFTSYTIGPSTRLMYRAIAANPWIANGTHTDAVVNTVKRTSVNGLSAQFAFGKPSCSAYAATSVSGNTSPCISTVENYSVNASNPAHTYTWSILQGGGVITGGQGTPTVTISWGVTGQYDTVKVVEANDCNDPNPSPPTLPLIIHPIATSAITGNTSVATTEVATYSVTNTPGYTYSWSIAASTGGIITGGQGTNSVTIIWGAIPATYTVQVTTTRLCGPSDSQTLPVTVRGPILSAVPGPSNWTNPATWIGGVVPTAADYVEIQSGNTVTMNGNPGACYKLTINGTANWAQPRTTNAGAGGIVINSTGNISGTAAGVLTTAGGITGITNSDITSNTVNIIVQTTVGQNITSAGAFRQLTINANANNAGTIKIFDGGTLAGTAALTQTANSNLVMNGSTFSLATLDASASGNTVEYGALASQTVRAGTYHHLKLSTTAGANTKTLGGNVTVNGNLDITGVTLDVSSTNYALAVAGNWTNTLSGVFNPRFGTVTLNGASTQTITNTSAGGETFNNLNMTGAGVKNMSSPIAINFDFSLTSTLNTNNNNISIRGNFDNSGTYNTGTNNITFTNNTTVIGSSPTTFNNVIISAALTGHSANMNVTGNWTNNGTFTHNGGTVTLTGAAQTIGGTSVNTFNNLTLSGTGIKGLGGAITTDGNITINSTLDVSSANYGVNVKGNWINNGTFTPQNGTVTFNGTAAQSIGGTTATNNFYNLTQNNTAGVSLAQHQNLLNILTISAGTFTVPPAYNFTLKSTSTNTARIAAIPSAGADFAGNIIMERYTTGPTDWRMLSSAVSNATIANWASYFSTSGFTGATCNPSNCATPGCSATCNFPSVYWYDETVLGPQANGYVAATNVTNPLVPGRGYFVYLGPNPVTYAVTGMPNKFGQSYPVNYTPSAGPADDGWNLVSNNYPCAIDWRNLANWNKINIDSAVYVWNATSGSYASYAAGVGLNGGSRFIASQQAFWVKANAAFPVLSVVETAKVSSGLDANPNYLKVGQVTNLSPKVEQITNLSHIPMAFQDFPIPQNANTLPNSILLTAFGNGYTDETFIGFRQGATNNFDNSMDAWKISNGTLDISSVITGNPDLSISNLPPLTANVSIPVRLTVPVNGTYTIRRDSILMLPMSSCIILEDLLTNSFIDLRQNISYTFAQNASVTSPRFVLHIYAPITKQTVNVSCYGGNNGMSVATGTGTGPWNYLWKDSFGNTLQTHSNYSSSDTLFNLTAGTYYVTVNSTVCGSVTDTFIVNAPSPIQVIGNFAEVSCNGLSDGSASVIASGGTPPYYYLWSNGSTTSQITNLISQVYSVTVTDANGCSAVFSASVGAPVNADFYTNKDTLYISQNDTAMFTNISSGAVYYWWNFGDGSPVNTSINTQHFYSIAGTYTVTLIAADSLCADTSYYTLIVMDSLTLIPYTSIPYTSIDVIYEDGEVYLLFSLAERTDVNISVYNVLGEKLFALNKLSEKIERVKLPFKNTPAGIYIVVASMPQTIISRKIIVPLR